ncbi:MAG: DUF4834 domain-containing protein [Alistipes sp.]|nr:DUF4834 domain-containing protein [Alistipes sp.]
MNNFSNNTQGLLALIQRNLLTIIILLLLIVFAPGVFRILAIILLAGVLFIMAIPLILTWRMRRFARRMEEQMRQGGFQGGFDTRGGGFGGGGNGSDREGDVKVRVGGKRDKRVSDNVGDYVDFEEIKEDKNK